MNKQELIAALKTKFFAVAEEDMDENGKTLAGIKVWGISVFDLANGVITKRNLTFYTKGVGADEEAFWGNSEPNPTAPVPEPTFTDRTNTFIASKIEDDTVMFAYIMEISELTKKALVSAIVLPDKTEKNAIVSEDAQGTFTIEVL